MVRWTYILPRLVVLGLLIGCCWMALNPLLRWSLVRAGQAATGARIEISALSTVLSRAELKLSKLAIADPDAPMQNLVEADSAILDIDTTQLLRRRLIIDDGRLGGLRLNTDRDTSGEIDRAKEPTGPTMTERMSEFGEKWIDSTAGVLSKKVEKDLKSVELGRVLMARWPPEYQRLETEVRSIRDRGKSLIATIEQTKENPIQSIEHYQQLLANIDSLRRDTLAARHEFNRVAEQVRSDQIAIEQAKQHDVQYVKQHMQIAKLEPEAISEYLLGPELGPRVSQLVQWIQWGRNQLPSKSGPAQVAARGWNVVLPGMDSQPSILVRKLMVDGGGSASGQPFSFEGSIQGLTNQPGVYGKPATMQIISRGAVSMTIKAILDHTDDVPFDRLLIECPNVAQPSRMLGSSNKLAMNVAQGTSAMRIDLNVSGDKLDGVARFQQADVHMTPTVGEELGGQLLADRLTLATSAVQEIQADLRIGGTLKKPKWKLASNLGSQLANGLNGALTAEMQHRQAQLIATVNQEIDARVAKLEQELIAKQNQLFDELNMENEELDLLKNQLTALNLNERVTEKLIGEKGVLNKLFRR